MKNTVTVTTNELVTVLKNTEIKGGSFCHITMVTEPKMNKRGNPYFGLVLKNSSCNYLLGVDYESRVQKNESKEGLEEGFVVEPPKGKVHVNNILLKDEKTGTKFYLMVERFNEVKPTVSFTHKETGEMIDKSLFEDFLPKYYPSTKQVQERKVMVITPLVENIKEMSFNGNKYIVCND